MMIYKIHQFRIFAATIIFATLLVFVVIVTPPQKCVQVSVSVQEWHPYLIKRTRAVQAVDESLMVSSSRNFIFQASKHNMNKDSWFRARIFPSISLKQMPEPAKEVLDENDDYGDLDEAYEADDNSDEYDSDLPDNKVFEDGDFDYNDTSRFGSSYLEPDLSIVSKMFSSFKDNSGAFKHELSLYSSRKNSSKFVSLNFRKVFRPRLRNITLINIEGVPIVEDRIFWSDELEKRTPKGAEDLEAQLALQKLRTLKVQRVEPPTWNRCGRPKNQFVVFEDGSKACARYRAPHQYLVQGEILSFYLSRLLGIQNVPVVSLSAITQDFGGMWNEQSVKEALIASKWEPNTTVALIQWIENLERDKMPPLLLSSLLDKKTLSATSVSILTLPVKKLVELLQWSDLIVFDYITGNYDRVASMQDAADKENKPSILHETIHNLVRSKSNGALWLIDNESGLLDSYSLLYGEAGQDGRFLKFHQQMLNAICLFRRSTIERIRWLHRSNKAGQILMDLVSKLDPLFVPIKREKEVSKHLQQRIGEVNEHIERCRTSLS